MGVRDFLNGKNLANFCHWLLVCDITKELICYLSLSYACYLAIRAVPYSSNAIYPALPELHGPLINLPPDLRMVGLRAGFIRHGRWWVCDIQHVILRFILGTAQTAPPLDESGISSNTTETSVYPPSTA